MEFSKPKAYTQRGFDTPTSSSGLYLLQQTNTASTVGFWLKESATSFGNLGAERYSVFPGTLA